MRGERREIGRGKESSEGKRNYRTQRTRAGKERECMEGTVLREEEEVEWNEGESILFVNWKTTVPLTFSTKHY